MAAPSRTWDGLQTICFPLLTWLICDWGSDLTQTVSRAHAPSNVASGNCWDARTLRRQASILTTILLMLHTGHEFG